MSIVAMNWALRQRLESPFHQCLLYVIADSADPDGLTRHCDSEYLADHARMSRASVFRRLADLRADGLLETLTRQGARGQKIYEIRLNLGKFIDKPVKTRRTSDADEDESHGETQAETGQNAAAESHGETAAAGETSETAVAPVRPPQSHSGDCISPPVSEESPPNPPPGGRVKDADAEEKRSLLAVMKRDYPSPSSWNWTKVEALFDEAPLADCRRAAAASHAYAADIGRPRQPKPMRPDRWFRERMFENFPDAKIPEAAKAAPEPVWYPDDGDEFRAIAVACQLAGEPPPSAVSRPDVGGRWIRRARHVGPDLLRLAAWWTPDGKREFSITHATGSGQCEAWRARLAEWLGRDVKPQRIWTEPHVPGETDVPGSHPNFRVRGSIMGLRVPWIWPPRRDGTLSSEDEAQQLAVVDAGEMETEDQMEQEHERDAEDR